MTASFTCIYCKHVTLFETDTAPVVPGTGQNPDSRYFVVKCEHCGEENQIEKTIEKS